MGHFRPSRRRPDTSGGAGRRGDRRAERRVGLRAADAASIMHRMQFDAAVRRETRVPDRNGRANAPAHTVIRAVALQRAIAFLRVTGVTCVDHVQHRGMVVLLGHLLLGHLGNHRGVFAVRMRTEAAEAVRHRRRSRTLQRDREQQTDHGAEFIHAPSVVSAGTIFNTRSWFRDVYRAGAARGCAPCRYSFSNESICPKNPSTLLSCSSVDRY
jgi:hypothetical protein